MIVCANCIQLDMIYIYSAELFGTQIRSLAISLTLTIGNIGGGLTTYMIYLMDLINLIEGNNFW